ncbi:uncharacterized protein LOC135931358 isoform X2 [Gordionus sp. m RMFG-2023]|uniref:uncharacterized protein LOC135931358 isoform X2 n=1 Tax=Gordionus sp. m RMFG-2023 TaxID=3053472 RepID=UPI0031FCEDC5
MIKIIYSLKYYLDRYHLFIFVGLSFSLLFLMINSNRISSCKFGDVFYQVDDIWYPKIKVDSQKTRESLPIKCQCLKSRNVRCKLSHCKDHPDIYECLSLQNKGSKDLEYDNSSYHSEKDKSILSAHLIVDSNRPFIKKFYSKDQNGINHKNKVYRARYDETSKDCVFRGKFYKHYSKFTTNYSGLATKNSDQCVECICTNQKILCRLRTCGFIASFDCEEKELVVAEKEGCCPVCKSSIPRIKEDWLDDVYDDYNYKDKNLHQRESRNLELKNDLPIIDKGKLQMKSNYNARTKFNLNILKKKAGNHDQVAINFTDSMKFSDGNNISKHIYKHWIDNIYIKIEDKSNKLNGKRNCNVGGKFHLHNSEWIPGIKLAYNVKEFNNYHNQEKCIYCTCLVIKDKSKFN